MFLAPHLLAGLSAASIGCVVLNDGTARPSSTTHPSSAQRPNVHVAHVPPAATDDAPTTRAAARSANTQSAGSGPTVSMLPGDVILAGQVFVNLNVHGAGKRLVDDQVEIRMVGDDVTAGPILLKSFKSDRRCFGIDGGLINLRDYQEAPACHFPSTGMHEGHEYHFEASTHGKVFGQTTPFGLVAVPSRGGTRIVVLDPAYAAGQASIDKRKIHMWVPVDARRRGRMVTAIVFTDGAAGPPQSSVIKTRFIQHALLAHDYPVVSREQATFEVDPKSQGHTVLVAAMDSGAIVGAWNVDKTYGALDKVDADVAMIASTKAAAIAAWKDYETHAEGGSLQDLGGYSESFVCAYISNKDNADRLAQRMDLADQLGSTFSDSVDAAATATDTTQRRSVRANAARTATAATANMNEGARVLAKLDRDLQPLLAKFPKGCLGRAYPASLQPYLPLLE